jgi:hypothetical protein
MNQNAIQTTLNLIGLFVGGLATDTSWTALIPPQYAVYVLSAIMLLKVGLNSVNQGVVGQFKKDPPK